MNALLVFLGGGIGSLLRYGVQLVVGAHAFPAATFAVNVIGSFAIGCFGGLGTRFAWSECTCVFLLTGLCGGFTTFSTFSKESLALLQAGDYCMFLLYVPGSIVCGVVAAALGFWGCGR